MWVIKNLTTNQFFAGWDEKSEIITADSKIYASHFSSWDNAAYDKRRLIGNWKIMPKDEA